MFLGFCPAGLTNTARGVRFRKSIRLTAACMPHPSNSRVGVCMTSVPGESAVLEPQALWPSAARLALGAASDSPSKKTGRGWSGAHHTSSPWFLSFPLVHRLQFMTAWCDASWMNNLGQCITRMSRFLPWNRNRSCVLVLLLAQCCLYSLSRCVGGVCFEFV